MVRKAIYLMNCGLETQEEESPERPDCCHSDLDGQGSKQHPRERWDEWGDSEGDRDSIFTR